MKYLLSALCLFLTPGITTAAKLLHCEYLLDVESGKRLSEQLIHIEDGLITRVQQQRGKPADLDAADRYTWLRGTCLPGLIDTHVHLDGQLSKNSYIKRFQLNPADYALRAAKYARLTLLAGFTTVRNLGDTYNSTIALREAIDRGDVIGPRVFSAGKSLASTGGHADPSNGTRADLRGEPGPREGVVNSPAEARRAVRQRYQDGADLIKLTATGGVLSLARNGQNPQFTTDELAAIVATARDYGMTVAAHAHGTEGMRRAVLAGVTSIEHGTFMDAEVMKLMKQHGTWYVPTLSAGAFVGKKAREADYFPAVVRPKALSIGPKITATFQQAHESGVAIAFGTDSGVSPHGENAKEFVHMVEAGMSQLEAIQAATLNAARLLGEETRLGYIKPGMQADIIVVPGDPLEDIGLLGQVDFVMKSGKIYKYQRSK